MTHAGLWDRRAVLRAAAALTGAATAPLLRSSVAQADPSGDADALFKAGEFAQAAHAYEEILKRDPENMRAARQRGYISLLSNQFAAAEKYLHLALTLAPDDEDTNRFLGDCYMRQDKFALAAPRWRAAGKDAYATVLAAVRGTPYEIIGDVGRAPITLMDPAPLLEVSLNGGPPQTFSFYSRVPNVSMDTKVAEEAGLTAVAETMLDYLYPPITMHFGVLDSLKLGDIEVRNIPVSWSHSDVPALSDGNGMLGTWLFYHFLTTFDYAGRSLILRRRTPETAREVRAAAVQAGAEPQPLWMAYEHIPFSRGSIAASAPGIVGLNIGGMGVDCASMGLEMAEQLQIRVDYDRPEESLAGLVPVVIYPCYPSEVRLGNAFAQDAYCIAYPDFNPTPHGFDVLGHFAHSFWKPYNVTLDFVDMQLYVVPGKAT